MNRHIIGEETQVDNKDIQRPIFLNDERIVTKRQN